MSKWRQLDTSMWGLKVGDISFIIMRDYGDIFFYASYKKKHQRSTIFKGDQTFRSVIGLAPESFGYPSLDEAKEACHKKLSELREDKS